MMDEEQYRLFISTIEQFREEVAHTTGLSVKSVEIITISDTVIKLKFILDNDDIIISDAIDLPRGLQGERGPEGPEGPSCFERNWTELEYNSMYGFIANLEDGQTYQLQVVDNYESDHDCYDCGVFTVAHNKISSTIYKILLPFLGVQVQYSNVLNSYYITVQQKVGSRIKVYLRQVS